MIPFFSTQSNRAQSETLGVALLIGIAVLGAVTVAATGLAALGSDREQVGLAQAERSLSQFDARTGDVVRGGSDAARVDFGLPDTEGAMRIRPNEGWIWIRYTDLTGLNDPNTKNVTGDSTDGRVPLGALVYEQDGRTVGYQGGGVFRSDGDGSVVLSRPEFHYRNGTLTVPIVQIDGPGGTASEVQATAGGTTTAFPVPERDPDLTNRVDNTSVVVTVHSRYYRAWASFFRTGTSGIVTVDPGNRTATVQFLSLPENRGVDSGVIATAESGDFQLSGTGSYVDAYNSTAGPYRVSQSSNGTVRAVGDVLLSADATIDGTAKTGRNLTVGNPDAEVTGDGLYTIDYTETGTIGGTITRINGVATVQPIDTLVLSNLREIAATNDNAAANARPGVRDIANGLRVGRGESATLEAGRYYTESVLVEGGDLTLDTTGGNVTLAVEDWLSVTSAGGDGGNLSVRGNGTVEVYLTSREERSVSITGRGNTDTNLFVGKGSAVYVPGQRATQFRVFAPQRTRTAIAGDSGKNATFTGLVYAPDGLARDGWIFTKQAEVYGGLVGGSITLGQYGQVHYDQRLDRLTLPRVTRLSNLEYMHVAVQRLVVTPTS